MKNFILILFISLSTSLFAASVRGKVVSDLKPNEGLDFVNVILLDSVGKTINGAITNENGNFVISDVAIGNYSIEISYIGYKKISQSIKVARHDEIVRAGLLKLVEDAKMLEEFEVTAQANTMRFDIDKKVFNVEQSIVSEGGNANQVLENIPSVEVDAEGNVALRGSSNVEIWINGKPSGLTEDNRAQILEQMPANAIKSVELITNPSAKFSPEGSAGIINIVMKKSALAGYYGSVSAGVGHALKTGKVNPNIGANVTVNSEKVDFTANLGYRQFNAAGDNFTDRWSLGANNDTTAYQNQKGTTYFGHGGLFGRFGLDYRFFRKNTLSFTGMFMSGSGASGSSTDYFQDIYSRGDTIKYKRNSVGTNSRLHGNGTIEHLWEISDDGSELRTSVEYSRFVRDNNTVVTQQKVLGNAYDSKQEQPNGGVTSSIRAKSDFVYKLEPIKAKVEAGVFGSYQERNSNSGTDNYDLVDGFKTRAIYDEFNYNEYILAAYGTYGMKINKFSFLAGLRGEYTGTTILSRSDEISAFNVTKKGYFDLFPSAFLGYSINDDNEVQLNYTRRINRPRGRQLNSFVNVTDSTNISYGNPNLNPEYSSALELNYLFTYLDKTQTLSSSLYYRFTENVIQEVRFMNPATGVLYTTYENLAQRNNAGLELVSRNRANKSISFTTTLNFFYNDLSEVGINNPYTGVYEILQKAQGTFTWNARIMANFIITKWLSGQLTGSYSSPAVVSQGYSKDVFMADAALRGAFLNRKLSVALSVRDLFNTSLRRSYTSANNFTAYSENRFMNTMLNLSVSYNFGDMNGGGKRKKAQMDNGGGFDDSGMDAD